MKQNKQKRMEGRQLITLTANKKKLHSHTQRTTILKDVFRKYAFAFKTFSNSHRQQIINKIPKKQNAEMKLKIR